MFGDRNDLVATKDFPNYAHFPFEKFNPIQSRVFEFYDKDCNAVIAAATSAGYVRCMGDEELARLYAEIKCNRMDEAADHLSHYRDVDRWLCSAGSFEEWYQMIDTALEFVAREYKRRGDHVICV